VTENLSGPGLETTVRVVKYEPGSDYPPSRAFATYDFPEAHWELAIREDSEDIID
jgi:hypothetical protein